MCSCILIKTHFYQIKYRKNSVFCLFKEFTLHLYKIEETQATRTML